MTTEQQTEPDWAAKQADRIVDLVDTVKGYTTDKAVLVLRGLVFGLVILVLAFAALIMFVAIAVRMADAYLPIGNGVGDATWAAHLFIGGLLSIAGLGAWMSRRKSNKPLYVALVVDLVIIVVIACYAIFS